MLSTDDIFSFALGKLNSPRFCLYYPVSFLQQKYGLFLTTVLLILFTHLLEALIIDLSSKAAQVYWLPAFKMQNVYCHRRQQPRSFTFSTLEMTLVTPAYSKRILFRLAPSAGWALVLLSLSETGTAPPAFSPALTLSSRKLHQGHSIQDFLQKPSILLIDDLTRIANSLLTFP